MKFNELRYLIALSQEKHFGRAAKRSNVSQPTLSIAISNIEARLGVQLFERLNNEIKVTELGTRVVTQAQKVLDEVAVLQQITEQEKKSASEPLRLGAIFTIGPYLFPKILKPLSEQLPDTPLKIEEGYTQQLNEKLLKGELDALLLATKISEPNVVQKPLFDESLLWVLAPEHRLSAKTSLSEAQLEEESFLILSSENCLRQQVIEACPSCLSSKKFQLMEGTSIETIKQMVASHYGISILPEMAATAFGYDHLLKTIPVDEGQKKRTIYLTWRASFPRPKVINSLIDVFSV